MQPRMIEPVSPVETSVPVESESVKSVPTKTGPANTIESELIDELIRSIGQRRYQHWFDQKTRFTVSGEELVVEVGSLFLLNWLQRKFRPAIMTSAVAILGPAATLRFEVCGEEAFRAVERTLDRGASTKNPPAISNKASIVSEQEDRRLAPDDAKPAKNKELSFTRLMEVAQETENAAAPPADSEQPLTLRKRRYSSLDDFEVGPNSQLAMAAVREVCRQPGAQNNPLFLYGGVGLGKTHLLEGMAAELRSRFPALHVLHMTAENFTNSFTVALRQHALPSFRQKFRNADVLLMDDIDFLDSKRGIQEELLHTFKHLEAHGRQIVLTADRHPRLLTRTSEELKTRFLSGMVCRLETPSAETRRRILDRKAARLSGEFSPEALNHVAQKFQSNVRELEGALRTLQAYSLMTGKRVGVTAARQLLSDLERDCIKVVKLSDIERVVCDVFGLVQEELRSDKRVRSVSQPRMLAMYLARKHTRAAYSEIGAYFGGRNHSTVITAEKKIAGLLEERHQMRVSTQQYFVSDLIDNIEQQLAQAG